MRSRSGSVGTGCLTPSTNWETDSGATNSSSSSGTSRNSLISPLCHYAPLSAHSTPIICIEVTPIKYWSGLGNRASVSQILGLVNVVMGRVYGQIVRDGFRYGVLGCKN